MNPCYCKNSKDFGLWLLPINKGEITCQRDVSISVQRWHNAKNQFTGLEAEDLEYRILAISALLLSGGSLRIVCVLIISIFRGAQGLGIFSPVNCRQG